MKQVEHEVYLGDTVSADLSNNRNIEKRCNQSIGTISEIMIILKQISKGYFYFNIGLIMRESILLTKLLLNRKAWTNITKQQVLSLEKSDRANLIRFVNGHSRINEEILDGELCTTPIRYLLMQKRLMYLWHILQRDENELIKRVYLAQKYCTSKLDWYNQIVKDKSELDIHLKDIQINECSKEAFKKFVKYKVNVKRKQYLSFLQSQKSKSKHFVFGDKPASYLTDQRFSKEQAEMLLTLRSKTYQTKSNFCYNYKQENELLCDLCKLYPCSQIHILQCPEIVPLTQNNTYNTAKNPEMIYGNVDQQLIIVKVYQEYITIRERLLSEQCSTQSRNTLDLRVVSA